MLCLQPNGMTRRMVRQPISMGPSSQRSRKQLPPAEKTNSAICFLCLFDGNRVPSIRRLIRKPHTFCRMPIRAFDPSYYSPDAQNSLTELYQKVFIGPCDLAVDPSVETVKKCLEKHRNTNNCRVIIHYFGSGCHQPNPDGSLFFFTENREKYYPIQVSNYILSCHSAQLLIFDCNSAGSLIKAVQHTKDTNMLDIIALFSCDDGELLPISTDLPLDLFSLCLLQPYETCLWWHKRRNTRLFQSNETMIDKEEAFMRHFFNSILEAIAYDSVSQEVYDALFKRDPSVCTLFRGFLVAQHIFWSFHLNPQSIPSIQQTGNHSLWNFLNTSLDLALSDNEDTNESIFSMFMLSYKSNPLNFSYPLFSFFISEPDFHLRMSNELLNEFDSSDHPILPSIGKNICKTIVELKKPSVPAMLLLSKILATTDIMPYDQQSPLIYSISNDPEVLRAGVLSVCVSLSKPAANSFHRLMSQMKPDNIQVTAPFSSILFGLLIERAGKLINLPSWSTIFEKLLADPRIDVQITSIYALGYTKSPSVIPTLIKYLKSPEWIVRNEAIISIGKIVNSGYNEGVEQTIAAISELESDPNEQVRENAIIVAKEFKRLLQSEVMSNENIESFGLDLPESCLNSLLAKSVAAPHFRERFSSNVFSIF